MLDIWEDGRAVAEFESSAFEDFVFGAKCPTGCRGRVVRSIVKAVDPNDRRTAADLIGAFVSGLAHGSTEDD